MKMSMCSLKNNQMNTTLLTVQVRNQDVTVPSKSPSCLSPVMPPPLPRPKASWPDFVMKDSCSLLCNFTMNVNSFAFGELYRNGGILDICLSGHCIVTDVGVDLGTLLI